MCYSMHTVGCAHRFDSTVPGAEPTNAGRTVASAVKVLMFI